MRVVSGLMLLVFAASLAQGILIEENEVTHNTSPSQEYGIPLSGLTPGQESRLAALPGVRAHAVLSDSWNGPSGDNPWTTAFVGTCAQLSALTQRVSGCVDGKIMQLVDTEMGADPTIHTGMSFPFRLHVGARRQTVTVTLPTAKAEVTPYDPSNVGGVPLIIPPSMLPSGARPDSATLVLAGGSGTATVRGVLDGIAGIAPTAEVDPVGTNVDALQQITVIETLLALGEVMGLVIGVTAFVVAVTDRAVERRPHVTALALIGARRRTLRATQVIQVVLPLSIGLGLAVVAGKLAETSYLITGGGEIIWDWAGLPLLVGSAAGVVAVAALGSLPLVGRRVDPELIRRD